MCRMYSGGTILLDYPTINTRGFYFPFFLCHMQINVAWGYLAINWVTVAFKMSALVVSPFCRHWNCPTYWLRDLIFRRSLTIVNELLPAKDHHPRLVRPVSYPWIVRRWPAGRTGVVREKDIRKTGTCELWCALSAAVAAVSESFMLI